MDNDQAIEQKIQVMGLAAPRVTKDEIDALMARVTYRGGRVDNTTSTVVHAFLDGSFLLASGHSACVSPENFNEKLGFDMAASQAAAKARDQLWLLEGYALRKRLAEAAQPVVTKAMVDRFLTWPVPAHVHPDGAAGKPGRTGTNLLDAQTAQQMLAHVLDAAKA